MGAIISTDAKYRYLLWRTFKIGDGKCLVILLNPSTADTTLDDPTVRRCVKYAQLWGYGELQVVNLFAYRATNPQELSKVDDPIGPLNDEYIEKAVAEAKLIVCGWGNYGALMGRDKVVLKMLPNPYALCINKNGTPKHPLYCKSSLYPQLMTT